jgi:hypothetical protein
MNRVAVLALLACVVLGAREKKLPGGEASNEAVAISATLYDAEAVKEAVGSGLEQDYIVLELKVHPGTSAPFEIKYDNFILRSESSLEHTGPLAAGQIAGAGTLFVKTDDMTTRRRGGFNVGMGPIMGGPGGVIADGPTGKSEMKDDTPGGSQLDVLKKKILAEKAITSDASGLLFFPMSAKEKAKNLNLQCNTPAGTLRIKFK